MSSPDHYSEIQIVFFKDIVSLPVINALKRVLIMKLSVIIPTLNEAHFIDKTIRHIQRHGRDNIVEIVVVDGGSTDGTIHLAEKAGAVVLHSPQKGRGGQIHFGAGKSKGDVLYFVHADTLPPNTFATDINNALSQGWKMGNFQYRFDSESLLLHVNAFFTRFRWFFTQGGDRTFFIQRETYFALGGYNPDYVAMEEYEFLRRAKNAGYDFIVLPRQCVVSARKYERNSWLRVQLANLIAYNLWAWGNMEPRRLLAVYHRMLR